MELELYDSYFSLYQNSQCLETPLSEEHHTHLVNVFIVYEFL